MRKPTLATIFLIVFIDLIGFGIVLPLLQFWGRDLGASGFMVGLIIASFSIMQFLFAPFWGKLSDRFGRRPILLISLLGSTLSYVLFASSASWWGLLISRSFAGFCGANIAVAQAYIADITRPDQRSKGMGLIGMAFGLGFIFGPVIGGLAMGHNHNYALAGWIASGLCGINFVMAIFLLPESLKTKGTKKEWNRFRSGFSGKHYSAWVWRLLGVAFCTNLAFTIWETTFGMWLKLNPAFHFNGRQFAYLLACVGVVSAMVQGGLIGRLVKAFGEEKLLRWSNGLMIVANLLLPFCFSLGWLVVVLIGLALGNGICRPTLYGSISLSYSAEEQGTILGAMQSISSLARIVGPLLGGVLIDLHLNAPFWLSVGGLVIASILLLTGKNSVEKSPQVNSVKMAEN
ncbi:MAG: MFS transporter [Verrucomicrobiia bacterium]